MMNRTLLWMTLASGPVWAQETGSADSAPAASDEPELDEPSPTEAEEPSPTETEDAELPTEVEGLPSLEGVESLDANPSETEDATPVGENTDLKIPASPDEISIPYVERDAEAVAKALAEAKEALVGYCQQAKTVVIGKVLTTRVEPGFPDELVELRVETTLRGDASGVIPVRVPRAMMSSSDGFAPPSVIEGYRLLVFLDPSGTVINGNALFFMEAGHAFRNKRPDIFLRPRSDRDWIDNIDPTDDYVVYRIEDIETALTENPMRRNRSRSRRRCKFGRDK